jgi:uncharacterized protein YodC (DUF2158 family)
MPNDFKAGDVVQLKSGGPKMTIELIGKKFESDTKNSAKCVWFEKQKQNTAYFDLAVLRLADSDEPGFAAS